MALTARGRRREQEREALQILERTGNGQLVRAPQAATKTVGWASVGTPQVAEWDAATAIRVAYYANVYVWACVRAIATDVASLPFRVGADPSKPLDYDVRDPLAQLLGPPPGGPNKNTSPRRFWQWTVAQRLVTGRWAWEIERSAGSRVAALWPLPASSLYPLMSEGGDDYWTGYEYRTSRGVRKELRLDQVFYDWVPSAHDWREPESALQAARLPISVAVMQDRYDVAFLKNDARPASVVVHEAFETTTGRDAWRRQFTDTHQGPDNAGKVAFVEASEDGALPKDALFIQTLGLSQKDAEFIARYENTIRSIIVALGVPLSRLGDSSKRTFSNADRETLNYWHDTVLPVAQELADSVNIKLAPQLTSNVGWFDLSRVQGLEEDRAALKTQPAPLHVYVQQDIITKNEARAVLGLQPVPGGDVFLSESAKAAAISAADAATSAESGGGGGKQRQLTVAEVLQKVYLAVDVVITADEARQIVNSVGGTLDTSQPFVAPPKADPLPFQ